MLSRLKRASKSGASKHEKDQTSTPVLEDLPRRESTFSIKSTSSLRSAAKRLVGKTKADIDIFEPQPQVSLGDLFFSLPQELQVQILLYLPLSNVFLCRSSCRSFAALISENEAQVARVYTLREFPTYCATLFPNLPPHEYDIVYLYTMSHRYYASCHLSSTISEFIRTEIMRYTSNRARRAFQQDMELIQRTMTPLIFVLCHFFELIRAFVVRHTSGQTRPWHGAELKNFLLSLHNEAQRIMRTYYGVEMLVHAHRMHMLLTMAFARQMRPPTYMTGVERAVRGLGGRPMPLEALHAVLAIGGIDTVNTVLSITGFSDRRKAVQGFLDSLSSSSNVHWRENWLHLLLGPFPAGEATKSAISLPQILQHGVFRQVWDRQAELVLAEHGIHDPNGDWRSLRAFVSSILGYDILTHLAIPLHFQIPINHHLSTVNLHAAYQDALAAAMLQRHTNNTNLRNDDDDHDNEEDDDVYDNAQDSANGNAQAHDRWWE